MKVEGNIEGTVDFSFFLLKSGRKQGLFYRRDKCRDCNCLINSRFFCLLFNFKRRKRERKE